MGLRVSILLLGVGIVGSVPAIADSGTVNFPRIYHEAKAVSTTDLTAVAQSPNEPWVVVKVSPDPLAGERVYMSQTKPAPSSITAFGTYTVVSSLGSSISKNTGAYNWPITDRAYDDYSLASWELNTPFEYGGDGQQRTALCKLSEDKPGADMVSNIRLVPKGWEAAVLPAVNYLRSHPELTAQNAEPERELGVLLADHNPYLALSAAKLLIADTAFTPSNMETILASENATLIASVVTVCEIDESSKKERPISEFIKSQTPKVTSLTRLEGVAVGLAAASDILVVPDAYGVKAQPTGGPRLVSLNKPDVGGSEIPDEMKAVRQRLNSLDPTGSDSNQTWSAIDNMCRHLGQ